MTIHIKHIITINCPAEVVYKALTTKQGIQGWWTPDTRMDSKVAGMAEFIFGDRYYNRMEIIELQRDKSVAWLCKEGDSEWIGTDITFELEEREGKSLLRFGHNNWRAYTDFYASCNFQWAHYMRSLKSYCEKGKGYPFRPTGKDKELE